jgi:hypothetical protein
MTQQLIAWEWLERPGLDVACIALGAQGLRVQGHMVAEWDGVPLELRYDLRCGPQWQIREAQLELAHGGTRRQLLLRRHAAGWQVDGAERPDLAEALDIDIMGTPITNTLPIQRLAWEPGQGRDFVMAYIRVPDLSVQPVRQRYTALAAPDARSRAFLYEMPASDSAATDGSARAGRYHGAASGFSAQLQVDADGLVLDYPPYWRRIGMPDAD